MSTSVIPVNGDGQCWVFSSWLHGDRQQLLVRKLRAISGDLGNEGCRTGTAASRAGLSSVRFSRQLWFGHVNVPVGHRDAEQRL